MGVWLVKVINAVFRDSHLNTAIFFKLGQRVAMVTKQNGIEIRRKHYIGEYEYTQNIGAQTVKEVSFIATPTGLAAADVRRTTSADTLYLILTDHLE